MVAMIRLVWNAVLGPWRRGFFLAMVAAAMVALAAPALGWSGGVGLGVAFLVVMVAAFVAGLLPSLVGSRLINKGAALSKAGRYDEAIALFDSYPQRFGKDRLYPGRVALAMTWKGVTLAKSGRPAQALTVFDQVLRRFPDTGDSRSETRTVRVLLHRARTLEALGRREEAEATYDDVVVRFSKSHYSAVRKDAATAQAERNALSGEAPSPASDQRAATSL
jgi:tetratricopeptide (TPR) repeat protein